VAAQARAVGRNLEGPTVTSFLRGFILDFLTTLIFIAAVSFLLIGVAAVLLLAWLLLT